MKESLMVSVVLLVTLCGSPIAAADFQKGWDAYEKGDDATALREWTALAEQGHADAQYKLGDMYSHGQGVLRDDKQAVNWYTRAAGQGHADAQTMLGVIYDHGLGVQEDDKQAVNWYTRAAGQNHVDAQFSLGLMYAEGRGVPQDDIRAYMWCDIAAFSGLETARENRDSIAEGMTPAQRETARRLARECVKKNYKGC